MIKSTLHTLRFNARILERIEYFIRDFLATEIGIFLLVVMTRESVETKPQSDQQTIPITQSTSCQKIQVHTHISNPWSRLY
jgi:hypothetical protein